MDNKSNFKDSDKIPSTYKQKADFEIGNYWNKTLAKLDYTPLDPKRCQLPLARIKRLMKVEEEVRMIASEVPVLFSRITEQTNILHI